MIPTTANDTGCARMETHRAGRAVNMLIVWQAALWKDFLHKRTEGIQDLTQHAHKPHECILLSKLTGLAETSTCS